MNASILTISVPAWRSRGRLPASMGQMVSESNVRGASFLRTLPLSEDRL